MADFRQLAIEFVLEDNKAKSVHIAQQAAKGRLKRLRRLLRIQTLSPDGSSLSSNGCLETLKMM
ncbi:hypothetical protein E4U41_006181 [Claviceps citrina]|nr:hypothetical protein E4U41_006181 [Claviceps citrina]